MTTFTVTELKPGDVIVLSPEDAQSESSTSIRVIGLAPGGKMMARLGDGIALLPTARLLELANRGQLLRPQPVRCEYCQATVGQPHDEYCKEYDKEGETK